MRGGGPFFLAPPLLSGKKFVIERKRRENLKGFKDANKSYECGFGHELIGNWRRLIIIKILHESNFN